MQIDLGISHGGNLRYHESCALFTSRISRSPGPYIGVYGPLSKKLQIVGGLVAATTAPAIR